MSHPGLTDAAKSQLLIIDVQERLSSAMPAADMKKMARYTERLLQAAQLLNIPVLHTEQYAKGLGHTVEAIRQVLSPDHPPFEKTSFSCCGAEGFNELTNQRPHIIICGMETHVCVMQTALELTAQGKAVFIVEDGVISRNPEHKRNALNRMAHMGITITNHESVLFEWLRDAKHKHFKAVSASLR